MQDDGPDLVPVARLAVFDLMAEISSGRISFSDATFADGEVNFDYYTSTTARINFNGAKVVSGGKVYVMGAEVPSGL